MVWKISIIRLLIWIGALFYLFWEDENGINWIGWFCFKLLRFAIFRFVFTILFNIFLHLYRTLCSVVENRRTFYFDADIRIVQYPLRNQQNVPQTTTTEGT